MAEHMGVECETRRVADCAILMWEIDNARALR